MGKAENFLKEFEWHDLNSGAQFFDELEKRFFVNVTDQPLKIGFGHNTRRIEMITIAPGDKKDPALEALEGKEVIEE